MLGEFVKGSVVQDLRTPPIHPEELLPGFNSLLQFMEYLVHDVKYEGISRTMHCDREG